MLPASLSFSDRARGCLLGLACGDAVGTTVEFSPRGSFLPVTDMVGGGPFDLPMGAWTDDTSMALCLGTSLVECQGFDAQDQMNRYCLWRDQGYLSSTGTCFDIGLTVSGALARFQRTGEPFSGSTDPRTAGNGSIMRLAPIPIYYHPSLADTLAYAADSSRTTHGTAEAVDGCRLLAWLLHHALAGLSKAALRTQMAHYGFAPALTPKIQELTTGMFLDKTETDIRGSGYVVESLEAAIWCFWHTDTFEAAVLHAVNLGDDADTTGAVVGQIAGAYYGLDAIPTTWLDRLLWRAEIERLADALIPGSW